VITPHVDDLDAVLTEAVRALRGAVDRIWDVPATGLTWTCRETLEHVADNLFAYAGQLAVHTPETSTYVPFAFHADREGGPSLSIFSSQEKGNAGLTQVVDACGGLLSSVVRAAAPGARGWHPFGVSDPGGFAAMGTVETLLHLHDVAAPLGLDWDPDEAVVSRVLDRLFPLAPREEDPWPTLLWCTGRGPLDGVDDLDRWRWDSSVR